MKLYFSVDSALLSELGEKLVEKSYVALTELVKNAYDADAQSVTLKFNPIESASKNIKEIIVEDDGSGMDLNAVRKYWMRIATTIKKIDNVSPRYGRPRTGSKGIGRFACRRLGKHLKLITITQSDRNYRHKISIEFEWPHFKPGSAVTEISVAVNEENVKSGKIGTTLIISDIVDEWTQRDFDALRRYLVTLAANVGKKRKGFEEDPGFNVKLEAPSFEGGNGNLRDQILTSGWATLSGEATADGTISYHLSAKGLNNKEYQRQIRLPQIPNVHFKIGIIPLVKEYWRNPKVASLGNIHKIKEDWGGIHVRYNDFRIYPYGETGDDWLEIDRDRGRRLPRPTDEEIFSFAAKVKGVDPGRFILHTLSSNQYFGYVDIYSTTTPGLEIKANREGFIDSAALDQLKKFVKDGIHWATIYYNHFLYKIAAEETMKTISEFTEEEKPTSMREKEAMAIDVLQESVNLLINTIPFENKGNDLKKPIAKAIKVVRTLNEIIQNELLQMRLIASTNPVLTVFSHEVRSLIGLLNTRANEINVIAPKLPPKHRQILSNFAEDLRATENRFTDLMNLLGLLTVKKPEMPLENLTLKPRIIQATDCMKLIIEHFGIKVLCDEIQENIQVGPIREPELFSILINTLSNSIKAVVAGRGIRKIKFELLRDPNCVKLRVLDTGIGLDKKYWEEVFTPLIADPESRLYPTLLKTLKSEDIDLLGKGSGLGLNIIRQIMREHSGDVYFTTPPKLWSTCLEVRFK